MKMIRNSGSGDSRARKMVKKQYMKVVEGEGKCITNGSKENQNVEKPGGTIKEVLGLWYVPSAFPVVVLSIIIGRMNRSHVCEGPDDEKGLRESG